jgi:hypothetical protein
MLKNPKICYLETDFPSKKRIEWHSFHGKIDEIGSSIKVREVPKEGKQIGLTDR